MSIHLELYVTGPNGELNAYWRRVLYDIPGMPAPGTKYLLHTREGQKWLFPDGGTARGEHFDTRLDTYVVWLQVNEPANFEVWGFTLMQPSRLE